LCKLQSLQDNGLKIDIWGRCGNENECPKAEAKKCEERISNEYKFYIAFENALCTDYITEKIWHRLFTVDAVPIVLKRSVRLDIES
jgi:hypothetical protein